MTQFCRLSVVWSGLAFVLSQDVIKLLIWWRCLLTNDVSKVEWVFPEYKYDDNFEEERNVGKQSHESTQLVLITAIFLIFLGSAPLDQEEGYKVVHPGQGNQKDKPTESLPRDRVRIVKHV